MFLEQLKKKLGEQRFRFIGEEEAYRSAVLLPIVQVNGEWHILFEVRSFSLRKQPGDISFPGGRVDETDESPLEAALRETHEELGIDRRKIHVIGELSPLVTSPSFVIYPYVAALKDDILRLPYNKEEVEEIFTVPIKWLLNYEPYSHLVKIKFIPPKDFPYEKIVNGKEYQWRMREIEEWFYDYRQYTIWGLTARILKYFIEILKKEM
ncbi:CoA pyrophosphatase [Ureibacillus sp. FSL K6-8385]|uniref:CoA pyrophosphatase n=1 Tax=Ureibacillus terrenus TaxID=118246 RepID=A0A540V2V4_9BACL|nr:CoA pyrophosphatase [Ureibacillus terrenus]TQE91058.1 CoA pyrophosphatase [Ureibacillus terrenus]